MGKIRSTIFIDSNHSHNEVIGKSITGLWGLLGSTPVTWHAKRQLSVMTSTFGAEFTSLKKVVAEAVVCQYYCRSLGMGITKLTIIYEHNIAIVVTSTNLGSTLQQKSMILSYHFCRE